MQPDPLISADGLRLHRHHQPAQGPTRAHLMVVHGLGDHGDALPYRWLREALAVHGIASHGLDLRGHGRSEGPRVDTPSWQHLLDDLERASLRVQAAAVGLPCFLLGLSLGGLLALRLAATTPHRWRGVVTLAPALDAGGAHALVRLLLPMLARAMPRLRIDPGLDLSAICRDTDVAARYTNDPLFQRRISCRLAHQTLRALEQAQQMPSLPLPLLMIHGGSDRIVPPGGSAAWFRHCAGREATRIERPGALHNLLLEPDRDGLHALIAEWLLARSA